MKIVKWVLIVIVIIVAIPLITAIFVNKEYSIEREVVINRPIGVVFDYVKYLKNQNNFSKWAQMDEHMKKSYRGTDGTVGFVSAWDSDSSNVGKGEQEIKAIKHGEKIDYEIRFIEPFESTSNASMTTELKNDYQTKVKWSFNGSMPYPMNLMLVVMDMDKEIGGDLQTGLNNLKEILEKQ
jgi:uncharacterized membrane protein